MRRLLLARHATPIKQPTVPAREWPLSSAGQADAERLHYLLLCAPVSGEEAERWGFFNRLAPPPGNSRCLQAVVSAFPALPLPS